MHTLLSRGVLRRCPHVAFALIAFCGLTSLHAGGMHRPFMIVSSSDYDSLRAKSVRWPWSVMKVKAIAACATLRYDAALARNRKTSVAHALGSASALGYILDPAGRSIYVSTVERDVRALLHDIRLMKDTTSDPADHGMSVGPAHAAMMTYIALDIMHDDIDSSALKEMEDDCDAIAGRHYPAWLESKYAIEAVMELYHRGRSEEFIQRAAVYRDYLRNATSSDGVYTTGPGYAHSRLFMEERSQKKLFMDMCEYQGLHWFYSDPRFQNLHEWVFGYSISPFNRTYTFGDSPPTKFLNEVSSAVLRSGRFSPHARSYAAWFLGSPSDKDLTGGLFQYLFWEDVAAPAQPPSSRIFRNGGAWLLGRKYDTLALAGVLWNVSTDGESHNHFDANSINISGFGEQIFRNSGYDGWKEPDSAGWEWIHRDARSSNTLTLGGRNHADFRGGGITEGIVGPPVEYASGRSGLSLSNGTHSRSLMFVQPEGSLPGYFLVLDEVKAVAGKTVVNIYLHPSASEGPEVVVPQLEYVFKIRNCFSAQDIRARVSFLQVPEAVMTKEGYLASVDDCNRFRGKYLDVAYLTDDRGERMMVTAIIPYLADQPSPTVRRFENRNAIGMKIGMTGNVEDLVVVSGSVGAVNIDGVTFDATAAYWREKERAVSTYLVKAGNRMEYSARGRRGFKSNDRMSLVMMGDSGVVVSTGTSCTFFSPGVQSVSLDDSLVPATARGTDFVQVTLPAGSHRISLAVKNVLGK